MTSSGLRFGLGIVSLFLALGTVTAQVTDLAVSKSGDDVGLSWGTGTAPYRVIRSNDPRFLSGNACVAANVSGGSVLDPSGLLAGDSYFYEVLGDGDVGPAVCNTLPITPWQSAQQTSYPQVLTGLEDANHVRGYRFTALSDGEITELGGYFLGTKTVALFEQASGQLLGQAQLTSNDDWVFGAVSGGPVTVTAGQSYIVAVRLGVSGTGVMRWSVSFPILDGGVRIDRPIEGWTTATSPSGWLPVVDSTSDDMKGFVDVKFVAGGGGNLPPETPHSPGPVDGGTVTSASASLTWGSSVDPDGDSVTYDVEVRDSSATLVASCSDVLDTSRVCAASPLVDGETYDWQVTAVDSQGAASAPSSWSFTVALPTGCPTATLSMPQFDAGGNLLRGQDTGCTLGHGFGNWSSMPGVPDLTPACVELHDSYWVNGYDGDDQTIYHTWHPPVVQHPITLEICAFGHEHGNDPSASELFDYWGGWPAFGYAAEQFSATQPPDMERHEDHFGHKVTAATFRASIGNPPNTELAVYDAGFYCHFLSKIHQGSHSSDAFTNQLHEYFISVRCDDNPAGLDQRIDDPAAGRLANPGNIRTEFSLKLMMPFGNPDEFNSICGGPPVTIDEINSIGFDGAQIELSRNPMETPTSGPNPREIGCFSEWKDTLRYGTPETIDQLDLWTQPTPVHGPNWGHAQSPNLSFQAYYVVKDSVRVYDAVNQRAAYTVDWCKYVLGIVPDHRFCEDVTATMEEFDADSPFKGALRAVHFKALPIYNNRLLDSQSQPRPESFCTDARGENPSEVDGSGLCGPNEIRQKLKPFDGGNDWFNWTNPVTQITGGVSGSLYVLGQQPHYPIRPTPTSDVLYEPGPEDLPGQTGLTGLFAPSHIAGTQFGNGCPQEDVTYHVIGDPLVPGTNDFVDLTQAEIAARRDHAFCPVGIGHEKIVDERSPDIRGPN